MEIVSDALLDPLSVDSAVVLGESAAIDRDEYLNSILSGIDVNGGTIAWNVAKLLKRLHRIRQVFAATSTDHQYIGLEYEEDVDRLTIYTSQRFENSIKKSLTRPVMQANVFWNGVRVKTEPPFQDEYAILWVYSLFETKLLRVRKSLTSPLSKMLPNIIVESVGPMSKQKKYTLI